MMDKAEHSDKKMTKPEELQPLRGLMLGIYHLGVSLTWLNLASYAGYDLAAHVAAKVTRRMPVGRRPKYSSLGSQTTKAVEIYLVDKHRTLYTCRIRTCHVTLSLAAYISRTGEAFRATHNTTIQRSIPQLIVTCISAICLIVSYSST